MNERELLGLTNELIGDLTDFELLETEDRRIVSPIKDAKVLTKRIYPADEKIKVVLKYIALFIVFASAGALLCDWLNINWEPILSLRIAIRSTITAILNALRNAGMFLLDNKIVALLFGLVLLLILMKRR
jgi:hypothetical protein